MEKLIILLNGPSSSGKSTLSKELQTLFKNKNTLHFGIVSIDDFMKIATNETIYEDDVFEISSDMCLEALKLLDNADGVIIDHVITSKRIYEEFINLTSDYKHLLVHVSCPLDTLLLREKERGNRCLGSAKDSYDYLYPKEGYDIEVDTSVLSKEECALKIYEYYKNL